jgi:hypothetical protein
MHLTIHARNAEHARKVKVIGKQLAQHGNRKMIFVDRAAQHFVS